MNSLVEAWNFVFQVLEKSYNRLCVECEGMRALIRFYLTVKVDQKF